MSNEQDHIIYSAADFERYYNGTMPATEMHALEKAALEDPFLSDALDGYAFTPTPSEDIEALRKLIPPVKEEKKRGLLVLFNQQWLRIAAILVLVFGVSYIVFDANKKEPSTPTFAANDTKAVIGPAGNTAPLDEKKYDSTRLSNVTATQENLASGQYKLIPSTQNKALSADKDAAVAPSTYYSLSDSSQVVAEDRNDAYAWKDKERAADLAKKTFKSPTQKYSLEGKVTDQNGSPVAFATVSAKPGVVTQTDVNGNFSLWAKDSLMLANISAVGYAAVNQNLNTNNHQNIILKQDKNDLSEVVVTGYGMQKKKVISGATSAVRVDSLLQGRAAGLQISPASQPVEGFLKYDQYLDSVRVRRLTDESKAIKGTVILSFKVDRSGTPFRIQVEKSLSGEADAEAKRLLLQGPKWQYSKGRRTSKSFIF